jgi:hypothetical protein
LAASHYGIEVNECYWETRSSATDRTSQTAAQRQKKTVNSPAKVDDPSGCLHR